MKNFTATVVFYLLFFFTDTAYAQTSSIYYDDRKAAIEATVSIAVADDDREEVSYLVAIKAIMKAIELENIKSQERLLFREYLANYNRIIARKSDNYFYHYDEAIKCFEEYANHLTGEKQEAAGKATIGLKKEKKEIEEWIKLKYTGTVEEIDLLISQSKQNPDLLRSRIFSNNRYMELNYKNFQNDASVAIGEDFISRFPNSKYIDSVKAKLPDLRIKEEKQRRKEKRKFKPDSIEGKFRLTTFYSTSPIDANKSMFGFSISTQRKRKRLGAYYSLRTSYPGFFFKPLDKTINEKKTISTLFSAGPTYNIYKPLHLYLGIGIGSNIDVYGLKYNNDKRYWDIFLNTELGIMLDIWRFTISAGVSYSFPIVNGKANYFNYNGFGYHMGIGYNAYEDSYKNDSRYSFSIFYNTSPIDAKGMYGVSFSNQKKRLGIYYSFASSFLPQFSFKKTMDEAIHEKENISILFSVGGIYSLYNSLHMYFGAGMGSNIDVYGIRHYKDRRYWDIFVSPEVGIMLDIWRFTINFGVNYSIPIVKNNHFNYRGPGFKVGVGYNASIKDVKERQALQVEYGWSTINILKNASFCRTFGIHYIFKIRYTRALGIGLGINHSRNADYNITAPIVNFRIRNRFFGCKIYATPVNFVKRISENVKVNALIGCDLKLFFKYIYIAPYVEYGIKYRRESPIDDYSGLNSGVKIGINISTKSK